MQFCVTGSLSKVLPHEAPQPWAYESYPVMKGEKLSLQIAYQGDGVRRRPGQDRLFFFWEGDGQATLRMVELAPVRMPSNQNCDDDYLTHMPAMLPDLLMPYDPEQGVRIPPTQWRSLWADILIPEAGRHWGAFVCRDAEGTELWRQTVGIDVSQEALMPQRLLHTEWFHADCLADYYGVEVFSEEHWAIVERFMACAAEHGVNMLLTPVVTPALDTQVGGERTTVQLAEIFEKDGVYTFRFDKLDRWIALCQKHGITEIEICHFFTQWGAKCAPKIMVHTPQGLIKRFGWETSALDPDYTNFLHQFIPALKDCLKKNGVLEHSWFHISDEPYPEFAQDYKAAQATVLPLLEGLHLIDALSDFELYQTGIVRKPVVSTNHVTPFLNAKVEDLWVYYCCSQGKDVSNRFMAMPSRRNRVLGLQLYLHHIQGFLHWGYNFYNSQFSIRHLNPFAETEAGEAFPAGDSFLVYPGQGGEPLESIRLMVLDEALRDMRALEQLEAKRGRAWVETLIGEEITFFDYPRNDAFYYELSRRVRQALQ